MVAHLQVCIQPPSGFLQLCRHASPEYHQPLLALLQPKVGSRFHPLQEDSCVMLGHPQAMF
jgi:hypothetical protein